MLQPILSCHICRAGSNRYTQVKLSNLVPGLVSKYQVSVSSCACLGYYNNITQPKQLLQKQLLFTGVEDFKISLHNTHQSFISQIVYIYLSTNTHTVNGSALGYVCTFTRLTSQRTTERTPVIFYCKNIFSQLKYSHNKETYTVAKSTLPDFSREGLPPRWAQHQLRLGYFKPLTKYHFRNQIQKQFIFQSTLSRLWMRHAPRSWQKEEDQRC